MGKSFWSRVKQIIFMHKPLSLITLLLLLLTITGCVSMPLDYPKTPSTALTNTDDTYLAGESAKWRNGQLQQNGFYSLTEKRDKNS